MRPLFAISFTLLVLIVACTKKKESNCPVTCGSVGAVAYFKGYSTTEIDTIIVRTYTQNSLFNTMQKEETISDTQSLVVNGNIAGLSSIRLSPGTDYEIFVLATADTFRVSMDYTSRIDTFPCARPRTCTSPFAGATITGGTGKCYATAPGNGFVELQK